MRILFMKDGTETCLLDTNAEAAPDVGDTVRLPTVTTNKDYTVVSRGWSFQEDNQLGESIAGVVISLAEI